MAQFINLPQSARGRLSDALGQSIGGGLSNFTGNYFANKALDKVMNDPGLKDAPLSERQSRLQAALQPYGQYGQNIFEKRLQIEGQQEKERLTKKEETLTKARNKAENKFISGGQLTPEEEELVRPELRVSYAKAMKPTGGIAAQPVPQEIGNKINEVLNANKNASADELGAAFIKAGIPTGFSSPYMENRRRMDEAKITQNIASTKEERKEQLDFHRESQKYDETINEKAQVARKQLEAVKDIRGALKSGKIQPYSIANIFKGVGKLGDKIADAFKNVEQGKFEAALPQLIEGWKDVFGVRLSDADLKIIENKLPSIGKDPKANEEIVKIIEKYAQAHLDREEISREIKKENRGLRPLNFSDMVEDRLQERKKARSKQELPDASQYMGKYITNSETGERLVSDGTNWVAP